MLYEKLIKSTDCLPWGEFWISSNVFKGLDLEDNLEAHLELCRRYRMAFLSLPLKSSESTSFDYRFFELSAISAVKYKRIPVLVVLDGPFQRLSYTTPVFTLLGEVRKNKSSVMAGLRTEMEQVKKLAEASITAGAEILLLADDLAFARNLYFSPGLFGELLHPLYSELVEGIHDQKAFAVFHSDGNITNILPQLISAGFDGINCQVEHIDLSTLKSQSGNQPLVFTTLPGEEFESDNFQAKQAEEFALKMQDFIKERRLVLCSCCGVNTLTSLKNRRMLNELLN